MGSAASESNAKPFSPSYRRLNSSGDGKLVIVMGLLVSPVDASNSTNWCPLDE